MCGICGFTGADRDGLLERMTRSLSHRGPDDEGFWRNDRVSLGHRRLSIIDLAGGHQPMRSQDGSLVVVFNGEIYNYREVRSELEAHGRRFRTSSDTEVLLELFRERREGALQALNGMFAFAVWDAARQELFIARDRIGIKPLYWAELGGELVFASEMKAILEHPAAPREVRPRAIVDYLALRYVPGPESLVRGIHRLPPGHWLRWRNGRTEVGRWWSPPAWEDAPRRSEEEWMEELGALLEQSVRRRIVSDVPFGAYLSGGLDSSLIVALMSRIVSRPVQTFSVGFGYRHDELDQAAFTARHLGCDHHEVTCRAEDVELLPRIVHYSDDPMGDPINIPMYQLSREAKRQVTVILTGEGGDEIFGGYLFHKIQVLGELYRRSVPRILRDGLVRPLLGAVPVPLLNLLFNYPADLGRRGKRKVTDWLGMLDPECLDEAYRHLISLFDHRDTEQLFTDSFRGELERESPTAFPVPPPGSPFLDRLVRLQFDHWLPDNMLLRQDKMGMANGIEGRVPFLDHELVEFGMRLPPGLKIRRLAGKWLLRRFGRSVLPAEVIQRKKMPFYVPIERYFRQPAFQDMLEELLGDDAVRRRGIFRPEAVARIRQRMHEGEFLYVKQVYSLMVLELWHRIFIDRTWSV